MNRTVMLALGMFAFLTICANDSFAATSKAVKVEAITTPAPSITESIKATTTTTNNKDVYISTNFVDLSKGNGNVSGDFFINETTAVNFSFRTASDREKVKLINSDNPNETALLTVDRASYILGATFFPLGLNKQINLLVSPGLAFGTKKSPLDVENQTGIALKASALIKTNDKLGIEIGLKGNNLEEGSFTTDLYAGLGLLF